MPEPLPRCRESMSWADGEWKVGLPGGALLKIDSLEQQLDRMQKERQQRQMQLDTLQQTLDKQRRKVGMAASPHWPGFWRQSLSNGTVMHAYPTGAFTALRKLSFDFRPVTWCT